jgi:CheY-like chemotaxis protein
MGLILVVDDDEGVTQTFARMLRLEGFDVLTAGSAEAGLQLARQRRPDAIMVDLRMPLINGLGFLYRLRNDDAQRNTPVAIVTGDFMLDDQVATEIADLDAEVRFKPLWEDELVDLARQLVSNR